MAKYCKRCGAYIPDKFTECFACGYDEAAEKVTASAGRTGGAAAGAYAHAAQSQTQTEDGSYRISNYQTAAQGRTYTEAMRRTVEENRRKQQEESKAWAEEEYKRRQAEQTQTQTAANTQTRQSSGGRSAQMPDADSLLLKKILCCLAYANVLWTLPLLLYKDDSFAQFHAKQGMAKFVLFIVCDIVCKIFGISFISKALFFFLSMKGMIGAANNRMDKLPIIGNLVEKYLK